MEPEMEIKSLKETDFGTICKAFGKAFADYELQLNDTQLQAMLIRRGYLPELSFGAFDGDELVAFTLNGIGTFHDIATAYNTGTGTLPDYRGQGLATKIFEYSIPFLRAAGIRHYLLEVLQHNTKAVSVYRNLGFEVSREFNYFGQPNEMIYTGKEQPDVPYSIKEVDVAACKSASGMADFHPSWQNSFESVERAMDKFVCLGTYLDNRLAGYCIFEPASGDVTQLAVEPLHRRKGIATALLREALKRNKHSAIKVINTDTPCANITDFLKARNIQQKGKQFEMIKVL